jgi:hypothetical protein
MTQSLLNQTTSRLIAVFYLLLLFRLSFAQSTILEQQINIPDYSGTAKILLDQISRESKIVFAYTSEVSLSYKVKY